MEENQTNEARRSFLKIAAKTAVYTPPAMMALAAPSREALARSARPVVLRGNNGVGNYGDTLPPGLQKNGKDYLNNDDDSSPGNPLNRGGRN
jgi:hypothetical protein